MKILWGVARMCFSINVMRTVVLTALVLFSSLVSALDLDPGYLITGKHTSTIVKERLANFDRARRDFQQKPIDYTLHLPISTLEDICSTPARIYQINLERQANGPWLTLPPQLVSTFQGDYQGVNLAGVLYTQGVNTGNGNATTFGNRIYFPRAINLMNRDDLWWLLHELEHTVQYARGGSQASKLCEYTAKSIGAGFEHDRIDMEQAADRKANYLIDKAYQVMNNSMPQGYAQSDAVRANEILISNYTDRDIVFDMETASSPRSIVTIPARTSWIYNSGSSDNWFNLYISTIKFGVDQWTRYTINGGSRIYIAWNNVQGMYGLYY